MENKKVEKVDMSCVCGFNDFEAWKNDDDKWYKEHCAKCIYGYEVCMYGEDGKG